MSRKSILSIGNIVSYFDSSKLIMKGENSYCSGHVQKPMFDASFGVIRSEVLASIKKKAYKVEIYISDGSISSSTCDCPRGLQQCHHMCAVAFFAHYNISSTDTACSWTAVKTKGDDAHTAEEQFPSTSGNHSILRSDEEVETAINVFYNNLKECGPTGFSWLLSPEPVIEPTGNIVADIESIIFSEEYYFSTNKIEYLKGICKLTEEHILQVESSTIGQHENPLWLITRKNRLTASNFGRILAAHRRGRYPPSLFKTLTGSYNLDGIKQIQWGRSHENIAIKAFEDHYQEKVRRCGIWLSTSGILGASPDGVLDSNGNTVIEVKCPYKYRDFKLCDCVQDRKDYIIYLENGSYCINKEHVYYHQMQGQIYLSKADKCKLVVWTNVDLVVVNVDRDPVWVDNILILEDFYFKFYVPYLSKNVSTTN